MLIFLKLGGSLITDKSKARAPRLDVIRRLAAEVRQARAEQPNLALVLGHGSGSFGHLEAKRYGTAHGVNTPEQWRGMAEVWRVADLLNRFYGHEIEPFKQFDEAVAYFQAEIPHIAGG